MATMRAAIAWDGDVRFTGTSGSGHALAIDGPPESGGQNTGPRPMELMLLGVGSCTSFDVVDILRKGRQQVRDCQTEVVAERSDSVPKVFTRIHFRFRITGHRLNAKKVERAIQLTAEKYCSASILLERAGVAVSHDFELIET